MISVLFETQHLYYLPQFEPVIGELIQRGHQVWVSVPHNMHPLEREIFMSAIDTQGVECLTSATEKERLRRTGELHPDAVVVGKSMPDRGLFGPDTMVALLYHGIGVKRVYYTAANQGIDLRFVEGPHRLEQCRRFSPGLPTHAVGFAKLDPLLSGKVRGSKSLPVGQGPRVLYAPTFYPGSLEILGKLIPSWPADWQIVIKPHQFTFTNPFYRYQRVMLEELAGRYKNITLLPLAEYNILPAYQWADILVSEASSTIIEFSALDKPVVVCDEVHLRLHHKWRRSRFMAERLDADLLQMLDFAHHCQSASQVAKTVEQALADPDELADTRRLRRDQLLGTCDGRASERVVAILEQFQQ